MAITPRSRGLGNVGNIVNRQGLASPTRPMTQPKPMARPVAQPMAQPRPMTQPITGGRTTLAQRQAMTPFRNYTKPPVAKMNPLTAAMQPIPQVSYTPEPIPQVSYTPEPQPFNPNPNPNSVFNQPRQMVNDPYDSFSRMHMLEPFTEGNPYDSMNMREATGQQLMSMGQQGLGQMFGNMNMFGGASGVINQPMNFFGGPTVDANGPAGQQALQAGQQALQVGQQGLGQMFGNPNPMTSDYDQLEGSAFNTNPSMSGSMFSGPGFSGY